MEIAAREAEAGQPVVLAFSDHDFRDMRPDVVEFQNMVLRIQNKYPHVMFRFCTALEAMRGALQLEMKDPCGLEIEFGEYGKDGSKLYIESNSPTFGPQPFFAFKTRGGQYFHDNLDFEEPFKKWTYVFDKMTYPIEAIEKIGIGTNDSFGNTTVKVIDPHTMVTKTTHPNSDECSYY